MRWFVPGFLRAAASAELPSTTAPIVKSSPVIDGSLDDAVWRQARPQTISRFADDTGEAPHRTEFRTLVAKGRLYVASGPFLVCVPWGDADGPEWPQWGGGADRSGR